jgi:hypothetical protein
MIMAATVDFGRLFLLSTVINNAARQAAVQLAVHDAADTAPSFADLLNDPMVRTTVYNPCLLVVDQTTDPATLPAVNEMLLRTAMISDTIGGNKVFRYPGAVFSDADPDCPFHVLIPQITGRDATGVETIEWVEVLEGAHPELFDPPVDPANRVITVRINYPFQAAMMTSFRPSDDGPFEPNIFNYNVADDSAVNSPSVPDVQSDEPVGAYSGPYGLGNQLAFAQTVRPYRRLLSGESSEVIH